MDRIYGVVILILGFVAAAAIRYSAGTHARRRREARRTYRRLQEIASPGIRFEIMRRMDPFAFEELIIIALRKHGYRAWHGRRYTGDGGIDGFVRVNGKKCLIQDKRYRGSIDSRHVAAFSMICRGHKRHGYFVHTGTTGESSWEHADGPWITIISGERLLSLIDKDSDFRLEEV